MVMDICFLPLHKNNNSKNHYVHRLVATSFIDNLYRKTIGKPHKWY